MGAQVTQKNCSRLLSSLQGVADTPASLLRYQPVELALKEMKKSERSTFNQWARQYTKTLDPEGNTPPIESYLERAKSFALETQDDRALVFSKAQGNPNGFIKLHLLTGELLVATPSGDLSIYLRLPVGNLPFSTHLTVADLADKLMGTLLWRSVEKVHFFPKMEVGAAIEVKGFQNTRDRVWHFEKHVLKRRHRQTLTERLSWGAHDTEFPSLFDQLQREFKATEIKEEEAWIQHHALQYEARAIALAQSTQSTVITINRFENSKNLTGVIDLMSYKFDTATQEMVILNRAEKKIVTFFKVQSDLIEANRCLQRKGLEPVRTPFEYFLALATRDLSKS